MIGTITTRKSACLSSLSPPDLFSNRTGVFRFVDGINNTDFTGVMLKNYGHTDVYFGTYSARDVSEPAYQWMLSHRMLVGEGRLVIDNVRYQGDMVIFVNATTINARVDGKSSSWNITEHCIFHHLEVYDGKGALGRIKIEINKECAVANGPGVHFQGRIVVISCQPTPHWHNHWNVPPAKLTCAHFEDG